MEKISDAAAPADTVSEEFRNSMLEFLLERIGHQKDFPALAESIVTINRIASSEEESIASLSNFILKDFALTNKLLKLVNSASFAHFGGGAISTVSRAVALLGFDAVKNVAITLLLLNHLKNCRQASFLKDEFLHVLFSGVLAREISHRALARGTEEAFICAMFHNFGRLLAMYYFSEEDREAHRIMAGRHVDEDTAAAQVLGVTYRELGMAVARSWRFPEQIIYSMSTLPEIPTPYPATNPASDHALNMDKLRMLAVFANELCATIAHTSCEAMPYEIRGIIARYADSLPLTERQLLDAVDKTMNEVIQYANVIQIDLQKTPFGRRISQTEYISRTDNTPRISNVLGCAVTPGNDEEAEFCDAAAPDAEDNATLGILTAGIGDISEALVDESPLSNTLRVILETLYRGLGFRHVLLCTVDTHRNTMEARFGFGAEIEALVANFKFPLDGHADLFQAAVAKGADIVIANIDHPHVRASIPEWYRRATTTQTFALFPLNLRNVPVALIYADKEDVGGIAFRESERGLLRTLRNQALLAIRQSL